MANAKLFYVTHKRNKDNCKAFSVTYKHKNTSAYLTCSDMFVNSIASVTIVK